MICSGVHRRSGILVPSAFLAIWDHVGDRAFSPQEVTEQTGKTGAANYVVLSRLVARGWLHRLGRGRYAASDPLVRLNPRLEERLRPFRDRCFYPVLERAVGSVLRVYAGTVIAMAVFGSVARGEAGPESDIDLLVVVDHRLESVIDDARTRGRVAESSSSLRVDEWQRARHFHQVQVVIAGRTDLESPGPLFLDLPEDARIIWDPHGELRQALHRLADRLRAAGARHHRSHRYGSFWDLGTISDQAPA